MLLQETAVRSTGPTASSDVERVRAAIARLSPTDRDLLVLRFRQDSSVTELAAATGSTPAAVQRRLHRVAWVVEDAVGPMPSGDERTALLHGARPVELAEEEALLGITPVLAARLVAAVGGETLPDADHRWRWHALLDALRHHGEGMLAALVAAAVVLPSVVSVAG